MTVDAGERLARVVMSRVCEPGDPDGCRWVAEESASELVARLRSGAYAERPKLADWAERLPVADYDTLMARADKVGARFLCPGDAEWPCAVEDLELLEGQDSRVGGAPFGLWVRGDGDLALLMQRAVAVVGSRAATAYGERVSGQLAYDCGQAGVTTISGGAYGIDAAAHRGAIASGGSTVAVLAGGIDRLYPAGNAQLLETVVKRGVIMAEAAPGCTPSKSRFLVRNRLIAALSLGTVVVEAAVRSGALNTARWAMDLNRGVMGVPGPVTSTSSRGVHELLRQPAALLVTDALEVIEHVSAMGQGLAPRKEGEVHSTDRLNERSRRVLEAVPRHESAPSASIARSAGIRHDDVVAQLHGLEALGEVSRDTSGWRATPR